MTLWLCVTAMFFYFRNALTVSIADTVITYGRYDDQVYVGDWYGDGKDTFMVRR